MGAMKHQGERMTDYFLSKGSHPTADTGRCALEWVSYLAGEPHSDSPECVSHLLTSFCREFNDVLDDDRRQRLRPYLARTIGTRDDGLDEQRSWLAMDWLIRTYAPAWLSLAGLDAAAGRLRGLPPVLAAENVERAIGDLASARIEAAIAWAIDGDVAIDAVGDAAWRAAWHAAREAIDGDAARDAAGDAAGDAVFWAAATADRDALRPTVIALQDSAFDLLDRMLPTEVIQLPVVADAAEVCGLPIGA
jgi:hypothetical protein